MIACCGDDITRHSARRRKASRTAAVKDTIAECIAVYIYCVQNALHVVEHVALVHESRSDHRPCSALSPLAGSEQFDFQPNSFCIGNVQAINIGNSLGIYIFIRDVFSVCEG